MEQREIEVSVFIVEEGKARTAKTFKLKLPTPPTEHQKKQIEWVIDVGSTNKPGNRTDNFGGKTADEARILLLYNVAELNRRQVYEDLGKLVVEFVEKVTTNAEQ